MHWPLISWGNACSRCMHKFVRCMHQPVTSQADACTYCMGSVVMILSQIYLISSYFGSWNQASINFYRMDPSFSTGLPGRSFRGSRLDRIRESISDFLTQPLIASDNSIRSRQLGRTLQPGGGSIKLLHP